MIVLSEIVLCLVSAGSDLVDWLHTHVEGFTDRRDARKYATNLLKAGYIRHTVNKLTFSEQCYYVFGDICGGTYCMITLLLRWVCWNYFMQRNDVMPTCTMHFCIDPLAALAEKMSCLS